MLWEMEVMISKREGRGEHRPESRKGEKDAIYKTVGLRREERDSIGFNRTMRGDKGPDAERGPAPPWPTHAEEPGTNMLLVCVKHRNRGGKAAQSGSAGTKPTSCSTYYRQTISEGSGTGVNLSLPRRGIPKNQESGLNSPKKFVRHLENSAATTESDYT